MDVSVVSSLDERLTQLERRIFGSAEKDAEYPKDTSQMVDAVHSINTQVHAATAGHKLIEQILKKLNELEECLDLEHVDKLSSVAAKADVIIAEEPAICERVFQLEKIQTGRLALDSEPIKAVPTLHNKLHELCKIHITQQEEAGELTAEVKQLISNYNNIILLLDKQFTQWNEAVTRLEAAAMPLPSTD